MTDVSGRNRVPSGIPTGGEFATEQRPENADLTDAVADPAIASLCRRADAATITTPREELIRLHDELSLAQEMADSDEVDYHVVHLLSLIDEHVPVAWDRVQGRFRFGEQDDTMAVDVQVGNPPEWIRSHGAELAMLHQQGVRGNVTVRNLGSMTGPDDGTWKAMIGHHGSNSPEDCWARMTVERTGSGWSAWTPRTDAKLGDDTPFGLQEAMTEAATQVSFLECLDRASGIPSLNSLLSASTSPDDDPGTFRVKAYRPLYLGPIEATVKAGQVLGVRNTAYPDTDERQTWGGFARIHLGRTFPGESEKAVREWFAQAQQEADPQAWMDKNLA